MTHFALDPAMTDEDWEAARKLAAATRPATFTSAEICRQTGLTYRQLDRWCRKGWLRPDQPSKPETARRWEGSGHNCVFSSAELDVARIMARLVTLDVTPERAAHIARYPTIRQAWLENIAEAVQP